MQSNEIQFRVVNEYLDGEKVSLKTFQAGRIGTNAKEIFRCLNALNLRRRAVYYKVLPLEKIGIREPVTYWQIRQELHKYRLYPISLEASLFLASTHWEWRKPEDVDIRFCMNPVETLCGHMGYMIKAPGCMLDGYAIEGSLFYPEDVFVFEYVKDLRLN